NFNGEELTKLICKLIDIDQDWVPRSPTSTLYVRPTMIGIEPSLGVMASANVLLFVMLGPVGPYYRTGFEPVSLLADPSFVRAWPGGTGHTKMGANYAPTLYVGIKAAKENCQQVLWLYGEEELITEVGAMNVFLLWTNEHGGK
ncbi:PREDICTED: branched-chain-amino-acid aminotransferase, cytosolic-like, partial [Priapulus caudatus]|uniref:Branched-chain-amino-acid aminotransferase, cytosolic-like n=1 Tax=Priapulus caudatus TaxID=37621 RepID=A0ABM1F6X5_PRICU